MLRDVSICAADGSLIAVIGPSGAGKTTLLRVAAGLVEHRGTVALDGRDVTRQPAHRRGVAMLFQEARLFDSMTVADNVAYPDRVRRVPRDERRRRALTLLDEVGLVNRAGDRTVGLSSGERHRVALARALAAEPRVLLLDEPMHAIDAPRRTALRQLIDETRRSRALTTVLVTHDLADATALADRLAVVVAGEIAQHDRIDVVLHRPSSPQVAALTGNPNVLANGSDLFTIRPEFVELGTSGTAAVVRRVDRHVVHDAVELDTPWGALHALVPWGELRPGDSTATSLPEHHCWRFPRSSADPAHCQASYVSSL